MLAALQAGNRGTQACITAASAVSGIIADLDTTIMFATAGTLNRENAETFADHRCLDGQNLSWGGYQMDQQDHILLAGGVKPTCKICVEGKGRRQTWWHY